MELSKEDKLQILLQQESHAITQMEQVKQQEMSWLRVFLLFYSACIAWSVSRWLIPNTKITTYTPETLDNEISIIYSLVIFSTIATGLFTFMFLQTRKTYYEVVARLEKIQSIFKLDIKDEYCLGTLYSESKISGINSKESWKEATKPGNSFLTRLVYLFGANAAVIALCFFSMRHIGGNDTVLFPVLFMTLNVSIFLFASFFDYHSFVKKANK